MPKIDGDRLKLEIQAYLKEHDPFVRAVKKGRICSNYWVSKNEFDDLCKIIKAKNPHQKIINRPEISGIPEDQIPF